LKKVTIETNAIIALENDEPMARYISELIKMNKLGRINLRLGAISASENLSTGEKYLNFSEFVERIAKVGLSDVEILKPVGYFDITYYGMCVYQGEETKKLEKAIQNIIHSNYEVEFKDHCEKYGVPKSDLETYKKWLNAKCDVLAMWCHIWYKGDLFVSWDEHFLEPKKNSFLD
jgi:hypothetical protein